MFKILLKSPKQNFLPKSQKQNSFDSNKLGERFIGFLENDKIRVIYGVCGRKRPISTWRHWHLYWWQWRLDNKWGCWQGASPRPTGPKCRWLPLLFWPECTATLRSAATRTPSNRTPQRRTTAKDKTRWKAQGDLWIRVL